VNYLSRLVEGENLSFTESIDLFEKMMDKALTDAQIGGILVALRMKGETSQELAGAVTAMRRRSLKVLLPENLKNRLVDTCGTGGDRKGTFNISTAVAFVTASCGVPVAKHGNRSVSSRCGSADVLEALGVKIELGPDQVARCIRETGFGFMFAPVFHPAMKAVARQRRELGVRTIFNLAGPLTNPAQAERQLVGVFSKDYAFKLAQVLSLLGTARAVVVHGLDGMDEATLCDATLVVEVKGQSIHSYTICPEDFGLQRAKPEELAGGDTPEENASILESILSGKEKGPRRDIVVLNTALALLAGGKAKSVEEGLKLAGGALDSGEPLKLLKKVVEVTNSA